MKKLLLMSFVLSVVFGSAAWASESSPCIGSPLGSAEVWTDFFPPDGVGGDFANPVADCAFVCTRWVSTCKGIADTARRCFRGSFSNLFDLERRECRTIVDNTERQTCFADLDEFQKDVNGFLDDDLDIATEFCNAEEATCNTDCLDALAP